MAKTRKQLREDAFVESLQRAVDSIKPYLTVALAVVVVAIAVAGVWMTLALRSERLERLAMETLGRAETAEELRNVPPQYLKTSSGPMILYRLAQSLQQEGSAKHRDELIEVYSRLLEMRAGEYLTLLSHMALGKLFLENGTYEQALKHFQEAERSPLTFRKAEAIWYQGWCLENMGQTEQAKAFYLRVRNEPLRSRLWREQATFRLSRLENSSSGG